jgi:hypothetical protein
MVADEQEPGIATPGQNLVAVVKGGCDEGSLLAP